MPYDEDDLQQIALDLRERYPDDDEFEAAMDRLESILHQEEADAHNDEPPPEPTT